MVFLVAELVDVQEAEESVSFFVPRQHQFGSRFFPPATSWQRHALCRMNGRWLGLP